MEDEGKEGEKGEREEGEEVIGGVIILVLRALD